MKKQTIKIKAFWIFISISLLYSCSVDKNEMALLYNNQILSLYNEVTESLNLFFESSNNDIDLKKTHDLAIKTTETAINNTQLLEPFDKGEDFKNKTIEYFNGSLKILKAYGTKIISLREEIEKQYKDELVDSLNFYVVKSYDELELLTVQFDNAHHKFAEQYQINIETDTLLSE